MSPNTSPMGFTAYLITLDAAQVDAAEAKAMRDAFAAQHDMPLKLADVRAEVAKQGGPAPRKARAAVADVLLSILLLVMFAGMGILAAMCGPY